METDKKAEAAGGGPDDTVRRWRGELDRAERAQRDWTRRATKVVERYRAEKRIDGGAGSTSSGPTPRSSNP